MNAGTGTFGPFYANEILFSVQSARSFLALYVFSCSCPTVKYARNQAWEAKESVTDVERRDIGQKTAQRDQVGHVGTGLEGEEEVAGILTQEIHMITTVTDIPHHQWTDSDHILTRMTDGPHLRGIPTTAEKETLMQDHHQSIMEELGTVKMSRLMTKPTMWPVRPAKTQISLGIRPV